MLSCLCAVRCCEQGAGRVDADVMRGVVGRLSVVLLDGFKEEEHSNPAAPGRREHRPVVVS